VAELRGLTVRQVLGLDGAAPDEEDGDRINPVPEIAEAAEGEEAPA
jgi:hypothetical protein